MAAVDPARMETTRTRMPRVAASDVNTSAEYRISVRSTKMHWIESARLTGVTPESLDTEGAGPHTGPSTTSIRGRALIFWDPKSLPGTKFSKKLDAIDTDQITPAANCVSESLDTLDERWKTGAFRYLMPDFRARVHRGETFVIAGDRFRYRLLREMSPAELKAVAEEAGLEMANRLRSEHGGHLPPQRL